MSLFFQMVILLLSKQYKYIGTAIYSKDIIYSVLFAADFRVIMPDQTANVSSNLESYIPVNYVSTLCVEQDMSHVNS